MSADGAAPLQISGPAGISHVVNATQHIITWKYPHVYVHEHCAEGENEGLLFQRDAYQDQFITVKVVGFNTSTTVPTGCTGEGHFLVIKMLEGSEEESEGDV